MGAAILAGVGIGVWPNVQSACKEVVKVADKILPTGTDYSVAFCRYSDLYPAVKHWNHTA
jgi:xylulokinase